LRTWHTNHHLYCLYWHGKNDGRDIILSALALDLFGCGVYTFPQGTAGAMSFHDPLEGTEISYEVLYDGAV
jgi:hypothetical protein